MINKKKGVTKQFNNNPPTRDLQANYESQKTKVVQSDQNGQFTSQQSLQSSNLKKNIVAMERDFSPNQTF